MNFTKKVIEFSIKNKLAIGSIQSPKKSLLGTHSICSHVNDGKGIIYCHVSGEYQGEVFYIPLGIGWFYKKVLKGSQSRIGLPISNEIKMGQNMSIKQVRFEVGVIEYDQLTKSCKAMAIENGSKFRTVFKEMTL